MDENELNEMALLQDLKQAEQKMERIDCENKRLLQTTEESVDGAEREAGTFPKFVE